MLEDRITPSQTFTPTTFLDDGSAASLRGTITQANNDQGAGTDTIQLQAGTYTLTIPNSAGHDIANATGDLNITNTKHALVIQGTTDAQGNPTTTITIDQTKMLDRVFEIGQPGGTAGITVTFKDLIIENGTAQDDGGAGTAAGSTDTDGGGILDYGGNVTLSNVALQSNKAVAGISFNASGGGIYVSQAGSLTIQSSAIQANQALGDPTPSTVDIGGSALGGGVFTLGQTTIANSKVSDNILTGEDSNSNGLSAGGDALGGGVFSSRTTTLTITDSALSGNTLTGGNSKAYIGGTASGGGVYAVNPLNISDCNLSGNTLTGGNGNTFSGGSAEGGGVYASQEYQTNITASTLSGNKLTGGTGSFSQSTDNGSGDVGGDAVGGGVYDEFGTANISTSNLSNNTLTGGPGAEDGTGVVEDNLGGAALGGGLYLKYASATVLESTLSNNILTGGSGTDVQGSVQGTLGGSASGGGGYVFTSSSGTASSLAIIDSTLSGNFLTGGNGSGTPNSPGTAQGGGVSVSAATGTVTATVVNSTIADNQVTGGGGGATDPVASGGGLFFGSATTATLTNDTVADNGADRPPGGAGATEGGGIANFGGAVTLVNTLVAGNSASNSTIIHVPSTGLDYFGTVTSSDHNLIGNAEGSTGFSAANGDQLGDHFNPLDPQLGPLQNNGGTLAGAPGSQQVVPTIALETGSPAINAGDNNAVSTIASAEGVSAAAATDERGQGFARVFGGTIDIGAFELQPPPPPGSGGSSPTTNPPPTLHTPPLLAFFDALLGGIETINSNDTETVTDRLFGILLFVSTYDGNGNLVSVTIFGLDVTFLFESKP